jgi:NADP-dependent 3-hydroxy acid dehydrogenase YdfG
MTRPLSDQTAIITGASRGIGKAIALDLATHGVTLCLLGRNRRTLQETAHAAARFQAKALIYELDLMDDEGITRFAEYASNRFGGVDILVHSAGSYSRGALADTRIDDFDSLYKANVRGPYLLSQALLEMLKKRSGQIVFINSTLGLRAKSAVGPFASTQHALRALADALREEVNPYGVRVASIFAGRTATPRIAAVFEMEGKSYRPELLLQPEDIANVVTHTLQLPGTAEVTDIHIRPLMKSY